MSVTALGFGRPRVKLLLRGTDADDEYQRRVTQISAVLMDLKDNCAMLCMLRKVKVLLTSGMQIAALGSD
jgi:hypothetical protein